MTTYYSVKQVAEMLQPRQLGIQGNEETLVFRPEDAYDPGVKALLETSGWRQIKKIPHVLQAYPTLENFYALENSSLDYAPTTKLIQWLNKSSTIGSWPDSWDPGPLMDFQKDGALFLAHRDRAMLSLSPGLGKTLTSAYAAGLKGFKNVLVVCPASLLYYWKGELEKWSDKLPRQPLIEIFHRGKTVQFHKIPAENFPANPSWWVITNPETAVKNFEKLAVQSTWDCMIVDESIMYKHRESQRSKTIKDLAMYMPTVWFLTGAPATRYLDDMWHQFHILKPQGYSSYWRFTQKYCVVDQDEWGSRIVANARNAEKKIKKNFADIYFSRTQDDVANIPDWIMEDIDIPMQPAQDKAYETLRKKLYIQLESIDPNEIITVTNHLSLMTRSVQVASNPLLVGGVNSAGKWDALPELMEIFPGPYIIWVNFIETGKILRDNLAAQKLKWPTKTGKLLTALANGSTPMSERQQMVDAMQNGELDALILNNQVGKFGFTLTKARTAFFVERMYDDSYFQCLHRNRRIGTTESPIVVNMRSVTREGGKTIDHLIHSTLDYRVGMIKKVTAADLRKAFEK